MLLHERDRFLGHAIFQVLIWDHRVVIKILELPWCNVATRWSWPRVMGNVHVESVLYRRIGLGT